MKKVIVILLIISVFNCINQQDFYFTNSNDTGDTDSNNTDSESDAYVADSITDISNTSDYFELINLNPYDTICGTYYLLIESKNTDKITGIGVYLDSIPVLNKYSIFNRKIIAEINVENFRNGSYFLKVEINNSYTEFEVNIDNSEKCDNPPVVIITEPENNSYISNNNIIRVKAYDDIGVVGVSFYVDNNLILYDTSAPYDISINTEGFEEGLHFIKAVAFDSSNKKAKDTIRLFFDTKAPEIEILTPSDYEIYNNKLNIKVRIADNTITDSVTIYLLNFLTNEKSILYNGEQINDINLISGTENIKNGFYSLVAEASDKAGNIGRASKVIIIGHNEVVKYYRCSSDYKECADLFSSPVRGILYLKTEPDIAFGQFFYSTIFLGNEYFNNSNKIEIDTRYSYDGLWDFFTVLKFKEDIIKISKSVIVQSCDQDRDGYLDTSPECGGDDCDDRRHSVNPGMPDFQGDGRDTNCDGIDGTDLDRDGFVAQQFGGNDCNDNNNKINPAANDIPGDDIDSNCDGIDGIDKDGDGFISNSYNNKLRDCNDNDPDIHPVRFDLAGDGTDSNCDGIDGEDYDSDGYASTESGGNDCDDSNYYINPGRYDYSGNYIDENCDGIDGTDNDRDGYASNPNYSSLRDCNDNDPDIHPGATDMLGDGVDSNCDGIDGIDYDQDGYSSIESGGDDCNDSDRSINPRRTDIYDNGIDENCDGVDGVDNDRDGYASILSGGSDCNDYDKNINPSSSDLYGDKIDTNCDGIDGVDNDRDGYISRENGGNDCNDNDPKITLPDCFNKCTGYYSDCDIICENGCLNGFNCISNICQSNICPEFISVDPKGIYPVIGYCPAVTGVSPYKGPDRPKQINSRTTSYTMYYSSYRDTMPVVDENGFIYMVANGKFIIFDNKLMINNTPSNIGESYSTPVIGASGTIYVSSYYGDLYALRKNGLVKWIFSTYSNIVTSPVLGSNENIYITSSNRSLYKISSNGQLIWEFITGGNIEAQQFIDRDENIYIYSNDTFLYKVSKNGEQIYRYQANSVTRKMAIDENSNIYFVNKDNKLVSLNADGNKIFDINLPFYTNKNYLIYHNKKLYYLSNTRYALFDIGTKTLVWERTPAGSGGNAQMPLLDSVGNLFVIYNCTLEKLSGINGENLFLFVTSSSDCTNYMTTPVITPGGNIILYTDRGKLFIIGDVR